MNGCKMMGSYTESTESKIKFDNDNGWLEGQQGGCGNVRRRHVRLR